MEIQDAIMKLKEIQNLVREYQDLLALQKHMEKTKKDRGIDWDITYMNNICKRMLYIEENLFDMYLK